MHDTARASHAGLCLSGQAKYTTMPSETRSSRSSMPAPKPDRIGKCGVGRRRVHPLQNVPKKAWWPGFVGGDTLQEGLPGTPLSLRLCERSRRCTQVGRIEKWCTWQRRDAQSRGVVAVSQKPLKEQPSPSRALKREIAARRGAPRTRDSHDVDGR